MNILPVRPGIGDHDDLTVRLHESTCNRWFPQIQSGTYYLGGREYYLYAAEGREDVTIQPGLHTTTLDTTVDLVTAAKNGPLLLRGEWYDYIRCTNCLTTFASVIPSGGVDDTLLSVTIPGELVLLTNSSGTDMTAVPGSGFLFDRDYYYFDSTTRTLYTSRNTADPNRIETLYATYLQDTPKFLQEELLLVDSFGVLRTTLPRVMFAASGTLFDPVLEIIGVGTISASAVSDNILFPEQALEEGTRVAVRYYVDHSFLAGLSGGNLSLQTLSSTSDHAVFYWERAYFDSHFDCGTFQPSGDSYIQLNPLLTGVDNGFLYLDQPRPANEYLKELQIFVSPLRLANKLAQTARITVLALDADELPLPKIPVACWIRTAEATYATVPLDTQYSLGGTDFRGEAHFSFAADSQMFGTYTVMASAITAGGETISTQTVIEVCDPMILSDAVDAGKVFLFLSPGKDALGYRDLYVYLTNHSGIPLLEDLDVLVWCTHGELLPLTTVGASGTIQAATSLLLDFGEASNLSGLRVAVCKYRPDYTSTPSSKRPRIYAVPQDATSTAVYKFVSSPLEVDDA